MANLLQLITKNDQPDRRNITLSYFSAFIILGVAAAILGPSLPYLAENTGTVISEISSLFATRSIGYMLGSWIGGHLYDRFAGHRILSLGLISMVIVMITIPVLPLLWVLAIAVFFLGFAEAVIDVGGNALLVWSQKGDVGPYMNALHAFFGVGAFLAPLFIDLSLRISENISVGYWLLVLFIIPVIFWIMRMPSPKAPAELKEQEQTGKTKSSKIPFWPILAIVLLLFLYVGAEVGFGGWVYTYALELGLASKNSAAYITSAFWGAFTLARFYSISLAARLRPRTMLIGDLSGCLLSMGIIMLWPQSTLALWIGAIGLGASLASIFPTAISLAERRFTLTGKITSWFFIGAGMGGILFPWIMGQSFEKIGPHTIMNIILINLVLATMLIFIVAAQPRKEA